MMLTLLALVVVFIGMVWMPRPWKALALLVVSFLPLSVGDAGGLSEVRVSEWLPALMAPVCVIDMLLVPQPVAPRRAKWVMTAVLVFGVLACVNALRFADVASNYSRAYWSIAVGILLVVEIGWYGRWLVEQPRFVTRALWILVGLAVGVAAVRLANYYLGSPLPFLVGVFRYGGQSGLGAGGSADRIGGLTEATTIGVAALAGLVYIDCAKRIAVVLGVYFGAIVVLSGGRMYALTMVAVVAVYVAVSTGRRGRALAGVLVVALVMLLGLQVARPASQLARLAELAGAPSVVDPYRYNLITAQLHEFTLHPLFGKGIGVRAAQPYDTFVAENVQMGGHSSYASMLANFGLAGGVLLLALLAAPIAVGLGILKPRASLGPHSRGLLAVAMFVIVVSVVHLGVFVTGGNGYSEPRLYAVLGLVVALSASQRWQTGED